MPLIVLVGLPCTGKSRLAQDIKQRMEAQYDVEVKIVSENDVLRSKNIDKNVYFMNSDLEKQVRGILMSSVRRELTQNNVVILDACNYIKGFRYKIYCEFIKYSKNTKLSIECFVDKDTAWGWNQGREASERYTREVFNTLALCYEAPYSGHQWDSPLVGSQHTCTFNIDVAYSCLFGTKPRSSYRDVQCACLNECLKSIE